MTDRNTTAGAVERMATARRIAADVIAKEGMTSIAEQIRRGNRDGLDTVIAALAAIIETTAMIERLEIKLPGVGIGLADGAAIARRPPFPSRSR